MYKQDFAWGNPQWLMCHKTTDHHYQQITGLLNKQLLVHMKSINSLEIVLKNQANTYYKYTKNMDNRPS